MPTTRFDTTITADRTIRIPDDWQLEIGTPVRVTKLVPTPPTEEEADEMLAQIKAGAARIAAGEFESEEERRAYEDFCRSIEGLPKFPADFKFDREEANARR